MQDTADGVILAHEWRCDLPGHVLSGIQAGVAATTYKGRAFLKSPFDVGLYLSLLQSLRPGTIIEIGTQDGGSALWFADTSAALGMLPRIIEVDLKPPTLDDPRIELMTGNATHLVQALPPALLITLPHPWLVIEDSAHLYDTSRSVLEFFDSWLELGDYIVIEDGVVQFLPEPEYEYFENGPNRAVEAFLRSHLDSYEIDRSLCDFYGYNVTYNPNGWLRRTAPSPVRDETLSPLVKPVFVDSPGARSDHYPMSTAQTPRHPLLRTAVRAMRRPPWAPAVLRAGVRVAIQRTSLPLITKQRLYNLFSPELMPSGSVEFSVSLHGRRAIRLEMELDGEIASKWYYFGYGGYEREVTAFISGLLSEVSCFIDIGANVGYYTLLAASLINGRGQVHAFEPHPLLSRELEKNRRRNDFSGVHLTCAAVCDRDEPVKLYLPVTTNGHRNMTNASLIPGFTAQDDSVTVAGIRLDTYVREHGVGSVDLVKVDIEGGEVQALEGMRGLLARQAPDLILEVLEPYAPAIDAFFDGTAYRKFHIRRGGVAEVDHLVGHEHLRDYYLSVHPAVGRRATD
jgi:FkbM family methyltransferase